MLPRQLSIEFVIPLHGCWRSPEEHWITPAQLFRHYTELTTPDEEVFGAAILVRADGNPWNTADHGEEFLHLEWWLHGIAALLGGDTSSNIWAWEESGMNARRDGDLVVLEEKTHHKELQLGPVCVRLREFATALTGATFSAVGLLAALKQVAADQTPNDWKSAVEAVRDTPRNPTPMSATDSEAALARMEELEKGLLRKVLSPFYKPRQPSEEERRSERLHMVLDYLVREELTSSWQHLAGKISDHV
jgi:hypothetical protein